MDHLFSGVLPFVVVAEERSFRRAAEKLGVTVAATSKAVQTLEAALGVVLLERTSRSVSLTREGEAFLGRAQEAVALVRRARDAARQSQLEPSGPFTLSLPVILSRRVMPACARIAQRYPAVTIHLRFTDQLARFSEDSVDAAVRIGELGDGDLIAQPLFVSRWVTVAAPAYLGRHGTPRHPRDLAGHRCLKFVKPRGSLREWMFPDKPGQSPGLSSAQRASTPVTFDSNYGESLLHAAIAGLGLTQLFDFMAADALRDGRLVEVLADFSSAASKVHLVYPQSKKRSARARAVLEPLREELRRSAVPPPPPAQAQGDLS